jgi:hypothetical protein
MKKKRKSGTERLSSEFLILPDGRIFVQNWARPMAQLLRIWQPKDKSNASRAKKSETIYEFPS